MKVIFWVWSNSIAWWPVIKVGNASDWYVRNDLVVTKYDTWWVTVATETLVVSPPPPPTCSSAYSGSLVVLGWQGAGQQLYANNVRLTTDDIMLTDKRAAVEKLSIFLHSM